MNKLYGWIATAFGALAAVFFIFKKGESAGKQEEQNKQLKRTNAKIAKERVLYDDSRKGAVNVRRLSNEQLDSGLQQFTAGGDNRLSGSKDDTDAG